MRRQRNDTAGRGGLNIYFLAVKDGVSQLWRVPAIGGEADAVGTLSVDIGSYRLAPDGQSVLFSADLFVACAGDSAPITCTKQRLDAAEADKSSGMLYSQGFVRHWDTWSDGRRAQLLIAELTADGKFGVPRLLTGSLDGDVPSKPFGDDSEYAFSPDGKTIYFGVRNVNAGEPWSTNFDIYSVPTDGSAAPTNHTADNKAWDAYPCRPATARPCIPGRTSGIEAPFCNQGADLETGTKTRSGP